MLKDSVFQAFKLYSQCGRERQEILIQEMAAFEIVLLLGENTEHHLAVRLEGLLKRQACVCVVTSQEPQSGSCLNYSATINSLHIHFS